jgi:hypothetical protein
MLLEMALSGSELVGPPPPPPRQIKNVSVGSKILEASIVWVFEALVGLIPLGAHYFIHVVATITERPALCDPDLRGCHLVPDAPYAEICILTVVIAGISVIGSLGFGHHFRKSELTRLTYALIALSGAACLAGFGMYSVTTVGLLSSNATRATWWALTGALLSSFVLSIEKAAREPIAVETC